MRGACWVSLWTPPGRGAVATVAVGGPRAVSRVGRFFQAVAGRPLDQLPENRILLGRWQTAAGEGEELIVCRRETHVEIHCHGGQAAAKAVIDCLVATGCQLLPWQHLVHATCHDPIAVEASRALARAVTQRTAAILLDQHQGALRRAVDHVVGHLASAEVAAAAGCLEQLLQSARLGPYLTQPFRVALCGPPNVGKSSLINVLAGYPRALVSARPGTTRDVLTARIALDGWAIELADTAGLHTATDPLESAGIAQARQHVAATDLVVLVFDHTRDWCERAERLYRSIPRALVVHNKCDLVGSGEFRRPEGLSTSAFCGQGMEALAAAIRHRLVPTPPQPGCGVPFTRRQETLLIQTKKAVENRRLSTARELLRSVCEQRIGVDE